MKSYFAKISFQFHESQEVGFADTADSHANKMRSMDAKFNIEESAETQCTLRQHLISFPYPVQKQNTHGGSTGGSKFQARFLMMWEASQNRNVSRSDIRDYRERSIEVLFTAKERLFHTCKVKEGIRKFPNKCYK